MGESANLCENRLLSYRGAVNAPLGTSVGFSPMFPARSMKTKGKDAVATQAKVKTEIVGDDLYFVRAERGPVKIGRSFNVRERYKTLRCGSAYELSLLGTIEGGGWQEWLWHGTFGPQRTRGEWFAFSDELREAIRLAIKGADWTEALRPRELNDLDHKIFPGIANPRQHWARFRLSGNPYGIARSQQFQGKVASRDCLIGDCGEQSPKVGCLPFAEPSR